MYWTFIDSADLIRWLGRARHLANNTGYADVCCYLEYSNNSKQRVYPSYYYKECALMPTGTHARAYSRDYMHRKIVSSHHIRSCSRAWTSIPSKVVRWAGTVIYTDWAYPFTLGSRSHPAKTPANWFYDPRTTDLI